MKMIRKKLLAVVSTVLMVAAMASGLSLTTVSAYAAEDDVPAITIGSDILASGVNTDNLQVIYFGGTSAQDTKPWYVIGYNGTGNNVVARGDVMTLLSKDSLGETIYGLAPEYLSSINYSDSSLKKYLDEMEYGDSFSLAEKKILEYRLLQGGNVDMNAPSYAGTHNDTGIIGDDVTTLFWPLSVAAANVLPGSILEIDDNWWLSTPGWTEYQAVVDDYGNVKERGLPMDNSYIVRPACDIEYSMILLTSAAKSGKTSGPLGINALKPVAANTTNEWKLTLKDDAHSNFSISNVRWSGSTATFDFDGASNENTDYISAILMNASGKVIYYGRLNHVDVASGTSAVSLAGKYTPGDKLFILNENCRGDCLTDYASDLKEIEIPATLGIESVALEVTQPNDGTVVSTPSEPNPSGTGVLWHWELQTNKPQVVFQENTGCKFSDRNDSDVWIVVDPATSGIGGLNATLNYGSSYLADFYFEANDGYAFTADTNVFVNYSASVVLCELTNDLVPKLHVRLKIFAGKAEGSNTPNPNEGGNTPVPDVRTSPKTGEPLQYGLCLVALLSIVLSLSAITIILKKKKQ